MHCTARSQVVALSDYHVAATILAESPPPGLTRLELLYESARPFKELAPALPQLRELILLQGQQFTANLRLGSPRQLAAATALRELSFTNIHRGWPTDDFIGGLAAAELPSLRRLAVNHCVLVGGELRQLLTAAPWASRLESLSLRGLAMYIARDTNPSSKASTAPLRRSPPRRCGSSRA